MFSIFTLLLLVSYAYSCPRKENIAPCSCRDYSMILLKFDVICSKITNEMDLVNAAAGCRGFNSLEIFRIERSVFNFIPEHTFDGVKFHTLEIVNSSLSSLSDDETALEGLQDELVNLRIQQCIFLLEWDWKKLSKLKKLQVIELKRAQLETINKDIEEISHLDLEELNFEDNRIVVVHDTAFAKFDHLRSVYLPKNKIEVVKRSMFPDPATNLRIINLSFNNIRQLPEDIFSNMPAITHIYLNNNYLLTLDENTFSDIWDRVSFMDIADNALRCDCRLIWITKRRYPLIKAACAEPTNLKGLSLKDIKEIDLWC